jgi:hypothetical protein
MEGGYNAFDISELLIDLIGETGILRAYIEREDITYSLIEKQRRKVYEIVFKILKNDYALLDNDVKMSVDAARSLADEAGKHFERIKHKKDIERDKK